MMNTIVIPTDFSECAEYALSFGVDYAKRKQLSIQLLHVINTVDNFSSVEPMAGFGMLFAQQLKPLLDDQMSEANRQMALYKRDIKKQGVEVNTHVEFGILYDRITQLAEDENCELVIMGSYGASGFNELLIGSNAQRAIRFSKKPTIILKDKLSIERVKKTLFVCDFDEEEENVIALNKLIDIVHPLATDITALFVNTPNYFEDTFTSISKIERVIKKCKNPDIAYNIVNDYSVLEGVESFCTNFNIDFVAMATHNYTGIKKVLNANVTESLANHLSLPLLSLPI